MLAHFMMNIEFLRLEKEFEETINFCKNKKADKIEQIELLEDVYENITDYSEKEALISRLQQGADYYDKLLELLYKLRQKSDNSSNGFVELDPVSPLESSCDEIKSEREPMNMLRRKYKHTYDNDPGIVNMKDLLEWFFKENKSIGCISTESITEMLYDTKTEEEFRKAKNSIAAQLRRGAEEERWQKIGRGFFAPNGYKVTEDFVLNTSEFTANKDESSSDAQRRNGTLETEDWDSIKF